MAVAKKMVRSSEKTSGKASVRKNTKKTTASKTKNTAKNTKKNLEKLNEYRDHQAFETGITIVTLGIVSLLLYLAYFSLAGNAGTVIGGLMFGIFGWFAWFLPISVLAGYIFIQMNHIDKKMLRKAIGLIGGICTLIALTDLIFNNDTIYEYYKINHVTHKGYFDAMFLACKNVMEWGKFNGGLLGRAFGGIFSVILGRVGATLILFALLILFAYIFYGEELLAKIRKRNAYIQEMGEIYEQVKEGEEYIEPSYRVFTFHENRKSWKKPMRELRKVPQVRSFDLMEQAEYFDGKKKDNASSPKKQEKPVSDDTVAEKTVIESKTAAEAQPAESKVSTDENPTIQEEEKKSEIENIPIYRNELEAKFGRAREQRDTQQTTDASETKDIRGEFVIQESAFDRFSKKKESMKHSIEEHPMEEPVSKPEDRPLKAWYEIEETASEEEILDRAETETKIEPFSEAIAASDDISENQTEPMLLYDEMKEEIQTEPSNDMVYDGMKEEVQTEPMLLYDEMKDEIQTEPSNDMVYDEMKEEIQTEPSDDMVYHEQEQADEVDFSDSVMIMDHFDDFVPQKPMSSFAPKEEAEHIVMDGDEGIHNKQSSMRTMSEPHNNVVQKDRTRSGSNIENGNRVFSNFSSFTQKKQEEEQKEEIKIEKPYEFPSLDLLEKPKQSSDTSSDDELRATALKLQETLESFNVKVKMGAVTCGPSVTRYELLPEQGVRVNKITNLADDLKLSLATASIRIEAPIPGKAAVGIEVPNAQASPVSFRELLEGEAFAQSKSPLTFAVGKDIAGKLILADIAKMPHLLIAGATGSGKSVCINTLIMSILYKADPKDVKLIMIDPKVVELSCYNGIPHLFCPVVTDPKQAAASLNWAVREMMERYNKFEELKVRNIAGYNDKIKRIEGAEEQGYTKMPYLVVIVDEFADLMMVASKDVEDAVCRLAQLARAAGIHLVLATQRPSVNVITGVIKANIPSRIAFSVSSAIDSRTILDRGGAEKLLGKGDMLFFPSGYTDPVRVQGAFISDQEVTDVVEFLCDTNDVPEYNNSVTEIIEEPQSEPVPEKKPQSDKDEYFADAGRFVIESDRAAAGQLQRRFSIGFNRAGRIIDQLEKAGVVGPAAGTKPREVLMTIEEFEAMLNGGASETELMEEAL